MRYEERSATKTQEIIISFFLNPSYTYILQLRIHCGYKSHKIRQNYKYRKVKPKNHGHEHEF